MLPKVMSENICTPLWQNSHEFLLQFSPARRKGHPPGGMHIGNLAKIAARLISKTRRVYFQWVSNVLGAPSDNVRYWRHPGVA
jgi:hypothetical protein